MTKLYYLQDCRGYVGNSVLWWAHNDRGYTCDIRNAKIFTEEEITLYNDREADKPWPIKDVLPIVQHHVDMQDLRCSDTKKMPHTLKSLNRTAWDKNELHPNP